MKIISNLVVLAVLLIAAVTASYSSDKSPSYSEPDSSEPVSSEISSYSATHYSAPVYSASEEESLHGNEEKETEAEYESETQSAKYNKEPEYTTTTTTTTDFYTSSTPAYKKPEYVAATPATAAAAASAYYSAPVYSGPAEVVRPTTMAVPIYRAPAVLPYWLRSHHSSSTVKKITATV